MIKKPPDVRAFVKPSFYYTKKPFQSASLEENTIGIEIENETKTETVFPSVRNWSRVPEHSLRYYGFEYVSKPIPIQKAGYELDKLFGALSEIKLTNSPRTSTHIHFDVGRMSFLQILNFAMTYWMMEPYLEPFVGRFRSGNHFCLRVKDTSFTIHSLLCGIQALDPYSSSIFSDQQRYSSVNFASIMKLGTLEFRLMRGVDTAAPVVQWINYLENIKKFSLKFKDPKEWGDHVINLPFSSLPHVILGSQQYPVNVSDLRETFGRLYELCIALPSFDFTDEIKAIEEQEQREKEEQERIRKMYIYISSIESTPITTEDYPEPDGQDDEYVNLGDDV